MEIEKYFDKIYCIHLTHRKDRLKSFQRNFKNLGTDKVKYFEAINGYEIVDHRWKYSKGALGCRLSHLAILKDAKTNNYNKILVFEDDAIIKSTFKKKLDHLVAKLGDDWDMIYFGGYHHLTPDIIDSSIIRLKNTLTTHAIAVNKRCYDLLINKIESDHRWVDSVIAELHPDMKVFGFRKPTVTQIKSYSDVMEKNVNYNASLIKSAISLLRRIARKFIKHS